MKKLKETIIKSASLSKEGHIPSALSVLDILWVLYDKILNLDSSNLDHADRDRFILSKGHASLGLYVVLAKKGFLPAEDLKNFSAFDSLLGGHPDRNKIFGVEASTGSLGHGFPISVGMALGLKIKKSPARVFVVVGDGECNEGTIWEGAMLAAHHNLTNLCCVIDYNHSTDRALLVGDLAQKFKAFGWDTVTVNGHDQKNLEKIFKQDFTNNKRPLAVIAETIKGYGVKLMENNPAWHHRSPSEEELAAILNEVY